MKEIKLTNCDEVTLIDDDDYDNLIGYKWYASRRKNGTIYAVTRAENIQTRIIHFSIHRQILGVEDSKIIIDHEDRNVLNNQKSNLRICTNQQNMFNRRAATSNKLGLKGVVWHKRDKKFQAQIEHNRKKIYLGQFETAQEAADAYDKKAIELFGEYAKTNAQLKYNS